MMIGIQTSYNLKLLMEMPALDLIYIYSCLCGSVDQDFGAND